MKENFESGDNVISPDNTNNWYSPEQKIPVFCSLAQIDASWKEATPVTAPAVEDPRSSQDLCVSGEEDLEQNASDYKGFSENEPTSL
jgi:hypothetical protein